MSSCRQKPPPPPSSAYTPYPLPNHIYPLSHSYNTRDRFSVCVWTPLASPSIPLFQTFLRFLTDWLVFFIISYMSVQDPSPSTPPPPHPPPSHRLTCHVVPTRHTYCLWWSDQRPRGNVTGAVSLWHIFSSVECHLRGWSRGHGEIGRMLQYPVSVTYCWCVSVSARLTFRRNVTEWYSVTGKVSRFFEWLSLSPAPPPPPPHTHTHTRPRTS